MPFFFSGIGKMKLKKDDYQYFIKRTQHAFGNNDTVTGKRLSQKFNRYCIVYGSLIEGSIGLNVEVKDIDVMVLHNEKPLTSPSSPVPYELQYVTLDDIIHEIHNEPKMLLVKSNLDIEPYFDRSLVRSSVSNVCSKAYNKGKKKLIVADDYDEYLGLKNLYHAMKFPYFAKWKFIDNNTYPQEDIDFLNDTRNKIFSSYKESTGTLEERFEAVNSWLKPLFNSVMTDFRKNFPKE
ncbi:hypothetical protein XaC1_176 [Xanthomonas phage XaC1]|nr:hypothetical protein XaC1_176 [Xanthomonas phage XaC1]